MLHFSREQVPVPVADHVDVVDHAVLGRHSDDCPNVEVDAVALDAEKLVLVEVLVRHLIAVSAFRMR